MAVKHSVRNSYMGECKKYGFLRLVASPENKDWLSIACFGPSLKDTWKEIQRPIMSVSGAHHFLIERGIVPDFHVDCDPRPHKVKFITPPHKDVTYLMASCCDPKTWMILRDCKVKTWHAFNGQETSDWIAANDPWSITIAGGSTVGLRALHIGGLMGYRKFNIYGMDGCYKDGEFRAGPSDAPPQTDIKYKIGGRTFETTDLMVNACVEYRAATQLYPIECRLHGDGMTKAYMDWFERNP